MTKLEPDTLEFLLQLDIIEELIPRIGKEQWQALYITADMPSYRFTMWCSLLDDTAAAQAMKNDSWDLRIGEGKPGFTQSWPDGEEVITYERFGSQDGVRPLVLYRSFYGAFPQYVEIDEEFRLYHDLAEDKVRRLLLSFDESGREIEVVRIRQNEVSARLKYLRQFQAGTRSHLAFYFDSVRYSNISLANVPDYDHQLIDKDSHIRWRRDVVERDFITNGHETFSRVVGKIILPPPPMDKAGIWPFEDENDRKTVTFIIGVDGDGKEIEHSSDPDELANFFGANPGKPHYLTPIYFRREVLEKYFAEPERYKVLDGRLRCLSLWSCQIDNDLASHVVAFLGDLGRDLPYDEQLHWRQFNVPPEGGVSETNFRRSFLNQFTDPESPDLTFRHLYVNVVRDWEKKFGWPLFLPLSPGDEYLLETVRVPVSNSQVGLDEQISRLTRLLVDSLNEKELAPRAGVLKEDTKGIGKLEGFLAETQFPQREVVIQLLRDMQTLRSTGSAHRKGSGYEKIIAKLGVDPKKKPDTVRRLLEESIAALTALRLYYCEEGKHKK